MNKWLLPLLALVVLVVLFQVMKPAPDLPRATIPEPAGRTQTADAPAPPPPMLPAPRIVELVVKDKRLVSGPAVISVEQGTPVTLRITVDHHDELHLHGYDLTLPLPSAETAELSFVADRSGRFEYELHHAHLDLGALEVQPR